MESNYSFRFINGVTRFETPPGLSWALFLSPEVVNGYRYRIVVQTGKGKLIQGLKIGTRETRLKRIFFTLVVFSFRKKTKWIVRRPYNCELDLSSLDLDREVCKLSSTSFFTPKYLWCTVWSITRHLLIFKGSKDIWTLGSRSKV